MTAGRTGEEEGRELRGRGASDNQGGGEELVTKKKKQKKKRRFGAASDVGLLRNPADPDFLM